MKQLFLIISFCSISLTACYHDSPDCWPCLEVLLPDEKPSCDSLAATPYRLRYPLATGELMSAGGITSGPKAVFSTPTGFLYRDLETGEILHRVESPVAGKALISLNKPYLCGDWALITSATGMAVLNRNTGALVWEQTVLDCDLKGSPDGVGDAFFVNRTVTAPDGTFCDALFQGNLQRPGQLEPLLTPAYSRSLHTWCGYGSISTFKSLVGEDGHTMLLIAFYEPLSTMKTQSFLALYDVTAQAWVYERKPLGESPASVQCLAVTGDNRACFPFGDKVISWDIRAGQALHAVLIPSADGMCSAGATKVWAGENRMLVETFCAQLALYDTQSGALIKKLQNTPCMLQVDFQLDRLFALDQNKVNIYEISTGRLINSITPPCENNSPAIFSGLSYWIDAEGQLEIAIQASSAAVYRYSS